MKKSFWGQFWESSRNAHGPLIVILGILLTLFHMSWVLWENRRKPFPNVIHARKPKSSWANFEALCLLEPSDLFSHGHVVSFYTVDEDGYEIFIAVGSVLNVQDDDRILVGIQSPADGYKDIISAICNNDKKQLEKLKIKPNIPQENLTRIISGGAND